MSPSITWSPESGRRPMSVLLVLLVQLLVVGPAAWDAGAVGGPGTEEVATPDLARHDVSLRSDGDGDHWTGRQRVSFRNASRQPLHEVYLRLWGNGEDGCGTPGTPPPVTVSHVEGGTPDPLTVGCTALRVALTTPLGPFRFTAGHDVDQIVWIQEMDGKGASHLVGFCNPRCGGASG